MEIIKICYVDDDIDLYASKYLRDDYSNENVQIIYKQSPFLDEDTYESLLRKDEVKGADVLIIDSKLFKNANIGNDKLSGEEFSIIIRKIFPYKEVMVITQNDVDGDYTIFKKYDSSTGGEAKTFFVDQWKPVLDKAIIKILACRKWLKQIEEKNYVEKYLMEQIQSSLEGNAEYGGLTVKDIDKLVEAFESVKGKYGN